MPCFRLGAFGTEGLNCKRINGLFSVLVPEGSHVSPLALDLLGYAVHKLDLTNVETIAAQVESDREQFSVVITLRVTKIITRSVMITLTGLVQRSGSCPAG